MQAGAREDKLSAVAESATSPLFTELERTALAYAEAMTITGHKVPTRSSPSSTPT